MPQVNTIDLDKIGTLDLGLDGIANPGDVITYTLTVENTGNTTLDAVALSDPLPGIVIGVLSDNDGDGVDVLAPGAIETATAVYRAVVTPHVVASSAGDGGMRAEPRVDRWIFSTDGVGYPIPDDDTTIGVPASKQWVDAGAVKHPAMFGFGPGIEQNTHKIGECVDSREFDPVIATLARFPSMLRETKGEG